MTNTSVSPPATYRSVAILRPGVFTDANGANVSFTDDDLRRIAENYDPAYHTASVNLDHAEAGPAQGFVADLIWDGAYLLADLSGVPAELAEQLAVGRYPCRSAEVYADLDGRGPYLRAVALLGARPPAVKGLPPLPAAETGYQFSVDSCQPEHTSHSCKPATCSLQTDNCKLTTASDRAPHILTLFMEAPMPHTVPATPPPLATNPAAPAPGVAAATEESTETIRLAEENQRLTEDTLRLAQENRELKALKRQREVRFFMAELRGSGQLTPALERSGVEQVLLLAEEQPQSVTLPDGRQALWSTVLRELLRALPVSFALGELAPAAPAAPPRLSPDDEAVMAALGLSAAEYHNS